MGWYAEYDVADDLTGAFSSDLSKGATEYFDSDFEPILARTRSNTTSDRDLDKIVFQDVILPSAYLANTEENDNMLEEIYATVFVKMINGKTIQLSYRTKLREDH